MAHQWIAIIFIPLEKNLHVHSEKEGKHKKNANTLNISSYTWKKT